MTRVFNFSAGPSQLPTEVLQKCAAELMEYGISGQSVMEMSHRSSSSFTAANSKVLSSAVSAGRGIAAIYDGADEFVEAGRESERDSYRSLDEKSDCGMPQDRRL